MLRIIFYVIRGFSFNLVVFYITASVSPAAAAVVVAPAAVALWHSQQFYSLHIRPVARIVDPASATFSMLRYGLSVFALFTPIFFCELSVLCLLLRCLQYLLGHLFICRCRKVNFHCISLLFLYCSIIIIIIALVLF